MFFFLFIAKANLICTLLVLAIINASIVVVFYFLVDTRTSFYE